MEELLGMRFLAKEYRIPSGRIDTLSLDENGSPIIIEYKWGQDDAIITQGLFYYDWIKKNKQHIDLLVADKIGKEFEVNWDHPRIVLISGGFDVRTVVAVEHFDFIDLIKYKSYEGGIIDLQKINNSTGTKSVRHTTVKSADHEKESDEEPGYDLAYHLGRHNSSGEVEKIFSELQKKVRALPDTEEIANQKSGNERSYDGRIQAARR